MKTLHDALPIILLGIGCILLIIIVHLFTVWQKNKKDIKEKTALRKISETFEHPSDLPPMSELAKQIYEKNILKSCLLIPQKNVKPTSNKSSCMGTVIVGSPDEKWPLYNEKPMIGICQINLKEAPYVPQDLSDIAFVALFMARNEKDEYIDIPTEDEKKEKWIIRAYKSLDELVPYKDAPPQPVYLRVCAVKYEVIDDHPGHYEDIYQISNEKNLSFDWERMLTDELEKLEGNLGNKIYGTKIGGYAAPIQDPILRPIAFQIGSEKDVNLNWVDNGCVYIWRNDSESLTDWEIYIDFY